ncbi:MAG: biotin synthase BioB [Gammaproteobacteria bacterium]
MPTLRKPLAAETLRHDWQAEEIAALFDRPFSDLMFAAQQLHRQHFDANAVQVSSLLSIKTGKCPEDCAYCPQSVRHDAELTVEPLMPVEDVLAAARTAKDKGAMRFCMGAAWRSPKDKDLVPLFEMIQGVKAMGLETCLTLGMLKPHQAQQLRDAGLDYYNHNLDTSPEFYEEIITTRTYADRLETLAHVRDAGMQVCCGGIVGMGEGRDDRIGLLQQLANQERHPESVPINLLVRVKGTPLEDVAALDPIEFVRTIAVARILMPHSYVRLSAGREDMSDEMQALCFLAGANSVFYGEKLLTTPNASVDRDHALFNKLGINTLQ